MSSDVSHPAWPQGHGGAQSVVVTHKGHVTSDALEMPLTRVYKSGTIRILVKNHHYTALRTGGYLPNSVSYIVYVTLHERM